MEFENRPFNFTVVKSFANGFKPPQTLALLANEVHLWHFNQAEEPETGPLENLVTQAEKLRALSFATASLKISWLKIRAWLRSVLGAYLNRPPLQVTLAYQAGGKPFIPGGALAFNLSHAGSLALLAITKGLRVGVDLEKIEPVPERDFISRRWFSQEEIQWIEDSSEANRSFLRCWVCREAFVKAIGCGLSRPMDTFRLKPPPGPEIIDLEGRFVKLLEYPMPADYVAAIALCY